MDIGSDDYIRAMLGLSALTYRRYASATNGDRHDDHLRRAIATGLTQLPPLGSVWQLAWGPETYRAPFSTFDDAMMFVVRDMQRRDRYVVALRGTNPLSLFDWVLGDLWVSHPVSWPDDSGDGDSGDGAAISMSTALGLSILRHLRSTGPGPAPAPRSCDAAVSNGGGAVHTALPAQIDALDAALRRKLDALRRGPLPLQPEDDALVACLREANAAIPTLFSGIESLLEPLAAAAHRALFTRVDAAVRRAAARTAGRDLLTFLQAAVRASRDGIEVIVTGHSKGGALAPALALWLAESLNAAAATVHCVAFAGPSPGNAAFASRFNTALAGRFDRVVNPRDIVPRAWEAPTLGEIPALYDPAPRCPAALKELVHSIAQRVAPLQYRHLGGRLLARTAKVIPTLPTFAAQMVYEHLDGYFAAWDLRLTTREIFAPVG